MRRFQSIALALLFTVMMAHAVVTAVGAKGSAAGASDALKAKLQDYEMKINQAFKDKDLAAFLAHVDQNGWSVDASGFMPVSQVAGMMKDADIQSFTIEDYKIKQINPTTCVATYVWKGSGSYKGQPFPSGAYYCSTVWSKQGADWKGVFHQESISMEAMMGMATPPPMGGATPPPTGSGQH